MKRIKYFALIFVFIVSICIMGCFSTAEDKTIHINQGDTYNWYVELGEGYYYSSSNPFIASVSQDGLILALEVGECTITATKTGEFKSIKVKVLKWATPSYPSSINSQSQEENSGDTSISTSINGEISISSEQSSLANSSLQDSSSIISSVNSNTTSISSTQQSANSSSTTIISSFNSSTETSISSNSSISSSSISSISSSVSSSSQKKVVFTINLNGGEIVEDNWVEQGEYFVTYELYSLPIPTKTGYNFIGWQYGSDIITEMTNGGFAFAVWEEKSFPIGYELNGGENHLQNPSEYHYFDEEIELMPATKSGEHFIGWFLDPDFKNQTLVIPNTKQKVVLYAKFDVVVETNFVYNGQIYQLQVKKGDFIQLPEINVESGYFIEWFTDSNYLQSYNTALIVEQEITLYGKLCKELTQSFFAYQNNKLTYASDMKEFQYYLEYTFFNEITSNNFIEVSETLYNTLTSATASEISLILNKTTMPFISLSRSNYTSGGKYYYQVVVSSKMPETYYTATLLNIEQYDYAQRGENNSFEPTRSSDFDNFKYQSLTREIEVKNSNQLFFALEHRIKPIPKKGSSAETALNKAKAILRQIVNCDMTDEEKALRIYRYICYNVTYNMPSTSSSNILYYDCFYLEGVLNNNQAVCDGICKTYSLLCNIEGIRCVRAASTSHAWNEVFIDGNWYTVDATHGNVLMNNSFEILCHDNFLINESIKESMGYTDILRTEINANGNYDYYAENTFVYNNVEYDYVIESRDEFAILLKWVVEQDSLYEYTNFTLDFILDYSYSGSFSTELSKVKQLAGQRNLSIGYTSQIINNRERWVFLLK